MLGTRAVTDKYIQVITYVCRGEKDETYYPTFSYYGGRYVRIEGAEESQLTPETVMFSEQNSDIKVIGSFSCSDELANRTVENTIRSDLSNFYYFPTDCPHREKKRLDGRRVRFRRTVCVLARRGTLAFDVAGMYPRYAVG